MLSRNHHYHKNDLMYWIKIYSSVIHQNKLVCLNRSFVRWSFLVRIYPNYKHSHTITIQIIMTAIIISHYIQFINFTLDSKAVLLSLQNLLFFKFIFCLCSIMRNLTLKLHYMIRYGLFWLLRALKMKNVRNQK